MKTSTSITKGPRVFHTPMRRNANGDFQLSMGRLKLRVMRNSNKRWSFGIYAPTLRLSGFLMSDDDWESAERASGALDLALTGLAIGLVTDSRQRARKPTKPLSSKRRRA